VNDFLFGDNFGCYVMSCCIFYSLGYFFYLFDCFDVFVLPLGRCDYAQIMFFSAERVRSRVIVHIFQLVPFAFYAH